MPDIDLRLYQVRYNFTKFPRELARHLGDLDAQRISIDKKRTRFELSLYMTDDRGHVSGLLVYREDLMDEKTACALVAGYLELLERLATSPEEAIGRA